MNKNNKRKVLENVIGGSTFLLAFISSIFFYDNLISQGNSENYMSSSGKLLFFLLDKIGGKFFLQAIFLSVSVLAFLQAFFYIPKITKTKGQN